MNYFITRTNFIRIVKNIKLTPDQLLVPIYKSKIYLLNKFEMEQIISVKLVLDEIQKNIFKLQKAEEFKDTFSYVNEYNRFPKYHKDKNCEALNSNFRDIAIPIEIKYKAGEKNINQAGVAEFRSWFKQKEIQDLFFNNQNQFYNMMEQKFKLKNLLRIDEVVSTGVQEISNLSKSDLEDKIDYILQTYLEFCYSNDKRAVILMREDFRLKTYLATSEKYQHIPIENNNTGYDDSTVREVLLEYHNKIKSPLINYLIDYYIISINNGLNFDENIMEQLEFKPCLKCVN